MQRDTLLLLKAKRPKEKYDLKGIAISQFLHKNVTFIQSCHLAILGFRFSICLRPCWDPSHPQMVWFRVCKTVVFPPYRFYPDKKVYVQVSVNYINLNDSVTVHHAIVSWTENVNTHNFTVCTMQAGRNGKTSSRFATVDWMAYQGAPIEGLAGTVKIQNWWSGTKCADV